MYMCGLLFVGCFLLPALLMLLAFFLLPLKLHPLPRRCAASSSVATAHVAKQIAGSPTPVTAPWLTPATTRLPCAWTTSRAAARVRSASTSTHQRICRPRSRQRSIKPTRRLWQHRLPPLPRLLPWWARWGREPQPHYHSQPHSPADTIQSLLNI